MNTDQPVTPARHAALNGLAVVGFVALVAAGIWLAIYSTRFVPAVVNSFGSAAVYLGSVFTPANTPVLLVIPNPTASTTISFGPPGPRNARPATSTGTVPKATTPVAKTPGEKTSGTYPIGGTVNAPYGLPDLTVRIRATGYLATTSAESFVASSTVPSGSRPAVKFTVENIGTNVAGPWRFSASIPTQSAFLFYSPTQQSLNPGDSIDYTLGFDQATAGSNKMISITANFDRVVGESNTNNNSASAQVTILGS